MLQVSESSKMRHVATIKVLCRSRQWSRSPLEWIIDTRHLEKKGHQVMGSHSHVQHTQYNGIVREIEYTRLFIHHRRGTCYCIGYQE